MKQKLTDLLFKEMTGKIKNFPFTHSYHTFGKRLRREPNRLFAIRIPLRLFRTDSYDVPI